MSEWGVMKHNGWDHCARCAFPIEICKCDQEKAERKAREKRDWADQKRAQQEREKRADQERAQKARNDKARKDAKQKQRQSDKAARDAKKAAQSQPSKQSASDEEEDVLGILITLGGAAGAAYLANLQSVTGVGLIIAAAIGGFIAYQAKTIIKWGIVLTIVLAIVFYFTQNAEASIQSLDLTLESSKTLE